MKKESILSISLLSCSGSSGFLQWSEESRNSSGRAVGKRSSIVIFKIIKSGRDGQPAIAGRCGWLHHHL